MAEKYRVFRRSWWKDAANTVPVDRLSSGQTIQFVEGEDEARRVCREYNCDATGARIVRPFGVAYEYERIGR